MKWLTLLDKRVQTVETSNAQQQPLGQSVTATFNSQSGHLSQRHHWRNRTVDFSGSHRYRPG